jgi:hypothetical protein
VGPEGPFDRLDKLTVAMPLSDSMALMLSGKGEVSGDFTVPPFSFREMKAGMKPVIDTFSVLGGPSSTNVIYATKKYADANPKMVQAFGAALREAQEAIGKDKDRRRHLPEALGRQGDGGERRRDAERPEGRIQHHAQGHHGLRRLHALHRRDQGQAGVVEGRVHPGAAFGTRQLTPAHGRRAARGRPCHAALRRRARRRGHGHRARQLLGGPTANGWCCWGRRAAASRRC